MKLKDKIAIVTGAASGIGRAEAILFSKEGSKIVAIDIDEEMLTKTTKLIEEGGGEVLPIVMDVSNEADVKDAIEQAVTKYGKIDILLNNAGVFITECKVADVTLEQFEKTMDINVKGQFLFAKYCIPKMIKNGGGVIVSTASTSGLVGQRGTGVYNASKAADIALIKNIALDYASDNIRANCICPAYIDDTKINKEIFEKARQEGGLWEDILKLHPIGRIGLPEDIAKCALFLASDDSSFATGAHFVVDGGYTAI